uniref:Uncharacterized protein n=1 Tax=Arundo donax TaxID=35708 RepID=A0A0A8ZCK0_ARUDO
MKLELMMLCCRCREGCRYRHFNSLHCAKGKGFIGIKTLQEADAEWIGG